MEAKEDIFKLEDLIQMSGEITDSIGAIDIDFLYKYLQKYVLMLKTMGKIVEIGFADVQSKSQILLDNKQKMIEEGLEVTTVEQLIDKEIEMGLKNVNGNNNSKHGIKKGDKYYTHIGGCRTTERVLRFLNFVVYIMENLYNNREDSLSKCVKGAYDKELAACHSFFLRNTIKGILFLLPSRDSFFTGVTKNSEEMTEEQKYDLIKHLIGDSLKLTNYINSFLKERD
jgi:hypothetical protein